MGMRPRGEGERERLDQEVVFGVAEVGERCPFDDDGDVGGEVCWVWEDLGMGGFGVGVAFERRSWAAAAVLGLRLRVRARVSEVSEEGSSIIGVVGEGRLEAAERVMGAK